MQLRALILPLALLVSSAAPARDARPAQTDVADFHGVAVSHGIRAEVKPGAKSVRLEGKDEDLARVKLVVKNGVLQTEVEKTGFFSKGPKDVRLYVTSPRVESVAASGGSRIKAEATRADGFSVAASGGSEISVTRVEAKKLEVAASGGSELTLEGSTGELEVAASGGSIIEARDVRTDELQVRASGGSRVEATAERSITGALSGGSMVKAGKKPERVEVNTSGGSGIEYP
ncbi:MAG TPA: head GIN domain-containing protein [Myxococcaceae bacterium]|nr:head GIN domain-containing protein [Myxococcaceae bacterium]